MIPSPWVGVVLALAVYRVARLVGWDDFPLALLYRRRLTGERVRYNHTESRDPILSYDRPTLQHFLTCPFCVGFWLSLVAYLGWRFFPTETLYVAAPLALSAAVGLIARNLDP